MKIIGYANLEGLDRFEYDRVVADKAFSIKQASKRKPEQPKKLTRTKRGSDTNLGRKSGKSKVFKN
uniref:Uncharacterized protein n=1 Tax=Megaselia scalaris TaxID=36166 RepID=T1GF42_MEGSC